MGAYWRLPRRLGCGETNREMGIYRQERQDGDRPQFDDYRFGFSQGLACLKQNGKCGLIDKNGASVVKPEWNLIEKYQEARDTPVCWEAARQDGEQVHVEFLDNTGKAICSSES